MTQKRTPHNLVIKIEESHKPLLSSLQTINSITKNALELNFIALKIPLPNLSPLGSIAIPNSLVTSLANLYPNLITSITPQLNEFSKSLGQMLKSINQGWLKDFAVLGQKLEQIFIELETQTEEVAPMLQKANLWISPYMSFSFIKQIIFLCKNPETKPNDVILLYVGFYSQDNYLILKEMVESWYKNSYFKPRLEIIKDALDAHIAHKYSLSIPTLLPIVEGIATDISGKRAGSPKKRIKEVIGNQYGEVFAAASKDVFLNLLDEIGFFGNIQPDQFTSSKYSILLNEKGVIENECLNRNAILHGVQLNYASEINSLKVFLILDMLSSLDENPDK